MLLYYSKRSCAFVQVSLLIDELSHQSLIDYLNCPNQTVCFSCFQQSPSLPRPYIGSRRNRQYINNNSSPLTIPNDSSSFAVPTSESPPPPFQTENNNDFSNARRTAAADGPDAKHEERAAAVKCLPSTILSDICRLHPSEGEKPKGFSSATSSSSSAFPSRTTHAVAPQSDYDSASLSFLDERRKFDAPHHQCQEHSYWQLLNNENRRNQPFTTDKPQQLDGDDEEEVEEYTTPAISSLSTRHRSLNSGVTPEENKSLSSAYSLSDTTVETNDIDHQNHHLASTLTFSSFASQIPAACNTDSGASLPFSKNNNSKSLPVPSASQPVHSSSLSTEGPITDRQPTADAWQLNTMASRSSLHYPSRLGSGTIAVHPYDQQISDQGTKYVIQLRTDEFQESDFTLTPRCALNQLVVDAKHREEDSAGGYVHRELHKIFNIPKHIDLNRRTYSYDQRTQELTIELPYLNPNNVASGSSASIVAPPRSTTGSSTYPYGSNDRTGSGQSPSDHSTRSHADYDSRHTSPKPFDFDIFHRSVFRPKIVPTAADDRWHGVTEKKLIMTLDLSDYQAEDIKVSVKDRELIVQAERKTETDSRKSRSSFFQSTTLPPQTDIEQLLSNYMDGKLVIEAPYLDRNPTGERIQSVPSSSSSGLNRGTHW